MHYLEHELKQTDPSKIAYIAFSNAAADEAKKRITNDNVIVSTMHAFGSRELQLNTSTHLLKGDKWKGFKTSQTYVLTYLLKVTSMNLVILNIKIVI